MLTLEEIFNDVANAPSFSHIDNINVGSRGKDGQSPLHWMATLGDTGGIRLLLEAGADINSTDNSGNTPLHEAVVWRQTSTARFFIESGADVLVKNHFGLTALDIAKSDGFAPTIELLHCAKRLER